MDIIRSERHSAPTLLVFSFDEEGNDGNDGLTASRSEDGGLTWSEPTLIVEQTGGGEDGDGVTDKSSLTADPTDPDFVYATWLLFAEDGGSLFARSIDGGLIWEEPIGLPNDGQGNQIIVLPDGTLLHFAINEAIAVSRSDDKGETWDVPTVVAKVESSGGSTPSLEEPIRDGAGLFDIAVDPIRGAVYVVWQDSRFFEPDAGQSSFDQVAFSESRDGGLSWSEPVRISQTPASETNELLQQALIPSVAVTSDGTIRGHLLRFPQRCRGRRCV